MEHETREERGFSVIALRGDVDFHSSRDAREILLKLVNPLYSL